MSSWQKTLEKKNPISFMARELLCDVGKKLARFEIGTS